MKIIKFYLVSILVLIFIFTFSEGTPEEIKELQILAEEYAPYTYLDENEKLVGLYVDIIKALLKKTNNEHLEIKLLPWNRIYKTIQEKPNIMSCLMTRTPEREDKFKWVGPVTDRKMWIWKLKTRTDIKVNTLEDAKNYTISTVTDAADTKELEAKGFDEQLDYTHNEILALKKFLKGRADLFVSMELAMAYELKKDGRSMEFVERLTILSDKYAYYFAYSLETPDSTVKMFQEALDLAKKDGTFDKIKAKWLKKEVD